MCYLYTDIHAQMKQILIHLYKIYPYFVMLDTSFNQSRVEVHEDVFHLYTYVAMYVCM